MIFHAKGPPLPPPPYIYIYHCYISYIIYHCCIFVGMNNAATRDTMMTVPPQLTSSLPSFSYPASFRHPPPASSYLVKSCSLGKNIYSGVSRVMWCMRLHAKRRAHSPCSDGTCLPFRSCRGNIGKQVLG